MSDAVKRKAWEFKFAMNYKCTDPDWSI